MTLMLFSHSARKDIRWWRQIFFLRCGKVVTCWYIDIVAWLFVVTNRIKEITWKFSAPLVQEVAQILILRWRVISLPYYPVTDNIFFIIPVSTTSCIQSAALSDSQAASNSLLFDCDIVLATQILWSLPSNWLTEVLWMCDCLWAQWDYTWEKMLWG